MKNHEKLKVRKIKKNFASHPHFAYFLSIFKYNEVKISYT